MNIWLIVALVALPLAAGGAAFVDLEWRAFLKDTQGIFGGTIVLAAALIAYRGAVAKIKADREDAEADRKRRRSAFKEALASELIALGWEIGRTRANATQFAGLAPDMSRREIAHMRLRMPTLGTSEWQDIAALGPDISARYHQLIARIQQTNRFIEAVEHDASTLSRSPSVEEEVLKIAQPFRSLAETCAHIADAADRLATDVRNIPD